LRKDDIVAWFTHFLSVITGQPSRLNTTGVFPNPQQSARTPTETETGVGSAAHAPQIPRSGATGPDFSSASSGTSSQHTPLRGPQAASASSALPRPPPMSSPFTFSAHSGAFGAPWHPMGPRPTPQFFPPASGPHPVPGMHTNPMQSGGHQRARPGPFCASTNPFAQFGANSDSAAAAGGELATFSYSNDTSVPEVIREYRQALRVCTCCLLHLTRASILLHFAHVSFCLSCCMCWGCSYSVPHNGFFYTSPLAI